jgi:CRISPR-associated endonuclease/helicase Cas3
MSNWALPNEKWSHEGKTLAKHVEEVKSFLQNFLKFYKFDKKYFKIGEFLAEYHDVGKLHEGWEVGKKKGHSYLSYQYLLEKKIEFDDKHLNSFLQFLILKHHSILSSSPVTDPRLMIELGGKKLQFQWFLEEMINRQLPNSFKSISREEIINIVDVFGLFKIADVCSAQLKNERKKDVETFTRLAMPIVNEEVVKKMLKEIDEKRWNEQLTLKALPEIGILRAYTGWGKTSAGLLFFENKQPFKIFYLMPTITAINSFFLKLKGAVGEDKVSKYFYLFDTEIKEDEETLSNLFFYENFMTPYVVTTVDQFLLSFLQVGKYYTKRVMFRNAGLIIDEIHLLNPLILELLVYFIEQYRRLYNFKVLFMSASLPSCLMKYLSENLRLEKNSFKDFSSGYEKKRRVMWNFFEDSIDNHLEEIVKEKNNGKRVLVIVNTVEKAVKLGRKLEEEFKLKYGEDFIILHARFMYLDRKEKEEWIENHRKNSHILIATQVCEVSLDISYDFLFTELASLPALIQRFGRVNRYGERIDGINCYIFEIDESDKEKIRRGKYPYSEKELDCARRICKELEGDKLRNEKLLIEKLDEFITYEEFQKELEEIYKKRKIDIKRWEDLLKFFYSLEVNEEKIKNILEYREGFTTLIIPWYEMIEDEELKAYVKNLIERDVSTFSFEERKKYFACIKEIAVPVPVWWVNIEDLRVEKGFPIIYMKDKLYNRKYGMFESKEETIIW